MKVVEDAPRPRFPPTNPPLAGLGPGVTVATVITLLDHVPFAVISLNCVVCPAHIVWLPVIAAGSGLTVTVVVAVQPVPIE